MQMPAILQKRCSTQFPYIFCKVSPFPLPDGFCISAKLRDFLPKTSYGQLAGNYLKLQSFTSFSPERASLARNLCSTVIDYG